MAILGKIQRKSSVLIGIIALALFAFIIQGLIKNNSSWGSGNVNVIAEVDGKKISRNEFQQKVALMQNQSRNVSNMQAMKAVWDNEIKKAVLNNQYEKLGINVGEDRVRELIVDDPGIKKFFTNQQGVFDENALNDYIKRIYKNKNSEDFAKWKNFEENKIESEKEKIYTDLIKAGMNPTLQEGADLYHFENDAVDFKYAAVPYTSIPDSTVVVTKEEIANYIMQHKDKYEVEETRDIEYVMIPLEASAKDIQRVKDELKKLIDDHDEYDKASGKTVTVKGFKNTEDAISFANENTDIKQRPVYYFKSRIPKEFAEDMIKLNEGDIYGPYELNKRVYLTKVLETKMVPDSAKAAHILVSYKGSAVRNNPNITLSKEEAKKKADSILKVVKRNPSKFADLAKEFSDDASNKKKGGDLGWFTYGQMVPKFNDFIFNGKKGDLGMVETDFGYHIVKVEDLTEPEKMLKTISIVRNIEPSTETENETFAKATQFASEALDVDDFKKFAEESGYQVKPVQKIGRYEDNLPGIGRNREIVSWAFKNDRKVGDITKFDNEKGHIIVHITAIKNKGLMSPEEASPVVKPILIKKKKAEIIKKKFVGSTLEEMAKAAKAKMGNARKVSHKNPVIPGFGKEPKVVAKAFSLKPKETSSPIDGNKAVYVVKTLKLYIAPDIKNYAPYVETLKRKKSTTITQDVVESLKKKAEIEDNRKNIYQ